MTEATAGEAEPALRQVGSRVSLSADFLYDLGEVLVRHGHLPASGASVPGAVGYALAELASFVRVYRDTPCKEGEQS